MHAAQRIMVNRDKYPHMMGSNPDQGIAVGKCHIHPSLLPIKEIHQLQASPPSRALLLPCSVYPPPPHRHPHIHPRLPLLGNKQKQKSRFTALLSQLPIKSPLPPPSHTSPPSFSKLVMINVCATHWAILIK